MLSFSITVAKGERSMESFFGASLIFLGFFLSLVWIPELGSGSKLEEREHVFTLKDSVRHRQSFVT